MLIGCAEAMSVRAEGPDWFKVISGNSSWNIVLEGPIELGDSLKVERALREAGNDGADVYIVSPGGNLTEGMKIGRAIRKAGANSRLGTLRADSGRSFGGKPGVKRIAGGCYSACTLAFLGGVYRFGDKESQYGVHRFSSSKGAASSDLDVGQIVSANIAAYIREMDVDPTLFSLMVEQGSSGIRLLTPTELAELNVTNDGRLRATWNVELVDRGQYLRGAQTTVFGEGRAALFCKKSRVFYYSFYDAGAKRARSIAEGAWYHSLLIDGDTVPLPDSIRPTASGATVSAVFPLTRTQALAIAKARKLGHAMQLARDAPTFAGYEIDIPKESAAKVRLFLGNCVGK